MKAFEASKDARLAREVAFAIPREMTQAQDIKLAHDIAQTDLVDQGVRADLNVYWGIGKDGWLQQRVRFDAVIRKFNEERSHGTLATRRRPNLQALDKTASGPPDLEYPLHDRDIPVTAGSRICMARKKVNVSTVFAGQRLGTTATDDGIWLASFMNYDLGYIGLEQRTLQRIDNPFGTGL